MKSFYASAEAVKRGLDPLSAKLVVVGDVNRPGSVVLAASPIMKRDYGIKTGSRRYEIPNDKDIIVVNANVGYYLNLSMEITKLFNQFVPYEAIHTYSIDESWVCTNGTQRLFGSRREVADRIQKELRDQTGLYCTIGIGDNTLLSKVVLDIHAKSSSSGIADCKYEDVQRLLWPVPIKEFWGIGSRMERNLNRLGIRTIEHLAKFPREYLEKSFGIMVLQLQNHAWGIDNSEPMGYDPVNTEKGFSHGITLLRDYKMEEVKTVILELSEEVAKRTREAGKVGRTISLGIGYSRDEGEGGFSRSRTIDEATNVTMDIYEVCMQLFKENYRGDLIRNVYVSITKLDTDDGLQLNLFQDNSKKREVGFVMDSIRNRFGPTAILRASSYTDSGIMLQRANQIGRHRA
ncbi:Y-family DNA polymerase [Aneurinibacillus sp. Ricciae_BoGa-3]|uniref:Y-family DNA polymerase n=1 Tax=Aneurinibacillus sp. Ricciae_BoGa-3 TaxID=3022697 RepID=UPI002FEE2C41